MTSLWVGTTRFAIRTHTNEEYVEMTESDEVDTTAVQWPAGAQLFVRDARQMAGEGV